MDYENFCSQILKTDPKIRFAAVYDQWAKHVGGGMREGMKSLLSEHMEHELVNLSIIDWKSRKDTVKMLGKTKYTMAEYEKVKRLTFYVNKNELLLVSIEPDADHELIIKNIKKFLSDSS